MSETIKQANSMVKLGILFALFGLLCPFFWMRFFAGDYGSETVVYGLHSGVFIFLGLIFIAKGWYDLKNMRRLIQTL
jgi:apolipoprotein N-acyltransferase